jgi:hypothetical protein
MPQQAYSLGLEYRDPSYWFINPNINYVADNYLDFSLFCAQIFLLIQQTDFLFLKQPKKEGGFAKTRKIG